jgi:archaeosine synthase beta-subunit
LKSPYPSTAAARTRWILARRGARVPVDSEQPGGVFVEREPDEAGRLARVLTVLLTNRECPWRCLMCDLWRHTTTKSVPVGAIPRQIERALDSLAAPLSPSPQPSPQGRESHAFRAQNDSRTQEPPHQRADFPAHLKLYNAGSFFDPCAIPPTDYEAIAILAARFDRLIVECHPSLVGRRVLSLRSLLDQAARPPASAGHRLEVAMGLETAHPGVLARLNKRMTLAQFGRAAAFLSDHGIGLRAFVLVQPPFMRPEKAIEWAVRSVEKAFDFGASAVSLIPTRAGNGALEALAATGQFTPPPLATLEAAMTSALRLGRGRVLADLWDLERFSDCKACFPRRARRLRAMNLSQEALPPIRCTRCGAGQGD